MKKVTFLLGAGAVMPWEGPKTSALTKAIRESDIAVTNDSQPYGEFLYQLLKDKFHVSANINFESIINLLEYLIEYGYSNALPSNPKQNSSWPILFNLKDEIDSKFPSCNIPIDNYQVVGVSYKNCFKNSPPIPVNRSNYKGRFYQEILKEYLKIIERKIFIYENKFKREINGNKESFIKFLNHFKADNYSLRVYTTNYDSIGRGISEINFFDGFGDEVANGYFGTKKQEIKKIMQDDVIDVYYNLHGSIHYSSYSDSTGFKFGWNESSPNGPFLHGQSNIIKDGKFLLPTNIITGFQKTLHLFDEPMSSFKFSFQKDCLNSDIIFIIGYSLSDLHLNNIINNALEVNSKVKLVFITKDDEIKNYYSASDIWKSFDNFLPNSFDRYYSDIKKNVKLIGSLTSTQNRSMYFYNGFEDFLNKHEWKNIFSPTFSIP